MLTVAAFVVLLGVLITVHELGHFLVAKACGVRVLAFSIGFGPRLVGFTRGETEYRIGVLPLGGYVRMYGDDITEEVPVEERHRSFLHQPFLKKSAIAVAGPLANLVLPVALFFAMFVGEERVPDAVVGTVMAGDAADQAGIQSGDRVVAIDGTPVALFSELQDHVEPRPQTPIRFTVEREGARFDVTVTPRAAPSPTIFDRDRTVGRLGIMSTPELPAVLVDPGSPAAAAGIEDLDQIVSVTLPSGQVVKTPTKAALLAALDAAAPETLELETVKSRGADGRIYEPHRSAVTLGGSVTLEVVTAPREEDGEVVPEHRRSVTLTADAPDPTSPPIRTERFAVTADELTGALAEKVAATARATAAAREATARRFGLSPVDGRVAHVAPETVAAERGLEVNEHRIVAVNGEPLLAPQVLDNALLADPDGVHVVGIVGGQADGGAHVLVFRMLPAPAREMGGLKVFGASLTAAWGEPAMVTRHVSPAEALGRGVEETRSLVVDVFRGFGLLFSGQVGLESLGGPITIARMSGQAAELGGSTFIKLMGLISVNLAVINLLPIPVLDGGHLMMFVVEAVTRRRITVETRMKVTKIGLVLVGLLMLVALGNDVLGLF